MPNSRDVYYPPEDTIGDQALRGSRTGTPVSPEWHARIAEAGYRIYLLRGNTPDRELDDWFATEHMLLTDLPTEEAEEGDQFCGKLT